jgi:hypothetical protein
MTEKSDENRTTVFAVIGKIRGTVRLGAKTIQLGFEFAKNRALGAAVVSGRGRDSTKW